MPYPLFELSADSMPAVTDDQANAKKFYKFTFTEVRSGSMIQLTGLSLFSGPGSATAGSTAELVVKVSNPGGRSPYGEGCANLVENSSRKWLDLNMGRTFQSVLLLELLAAARITQYTIVTGTPPPHPYIHTHTHTHSHTHTHNLSLFIISFCRKQI